MATPPADKSKGKSDGKSDRDGFSNALKRILSKRSGGRCCKCRIITSGPTLDPNEATSIGEAAHIAAAAPKGARYDEQMKSDVRSSAVNGMWLCRNCHTLIDEDVEKYTVTKLLLMKKEAEDRAGKEMDEADSHRPQSEEGDPISDVVISETVDLAGNEGESPSCNDPVTTGEQQQHDLQRLVSDLQPLVWEWRSLGVYLGVPGAELKRIDDRVGTPDNCFSEVIEGFLSTTPHSDENDREACKKKITEALQFLSKGNLAKDIENGDVELVYTLPGLMRTLKSCVAQWQQFALGLGLNTDFTDKLGVERRDTSLYFQNMLKYWLSNPVRGSRVDILVSAIRDLDKQNLAEDIKRKYEGKSLVVDSKKEEN